MSTAEEILLAAAQGAAAGVSGDLGGTAAAAAKVGGALLNAGNAKLDYTCWPGFAPVLYGQAVELLPPVFVALARRLEDPTALMGSASVDKELFVGLAPQDAPTDEVREFQRKLFPKDTPRECEGWPQWAMPPTKAAAENFDGAKDSRKTGALTHTIPSRQSAGKDQVFGRTSGDAKLHEATKAVAECKKPKLVAELLARWVREREDVQIPAESKETTRAIGKDVHDGNLVPEEVEKLLGSLNRKQVRPQPAAPSSALQHRLTVELLLFLLVAPS